MSQPFSPYSFGAHRGLFLGVFCGLALLVVAHADTIPFGGLLGLIMIFAYPVLIYRILRNASAQLGSDATLSAVWLSGLMAILCASLVAGVIALVYFKWISPDYILDRLTQAAQLLADAPAESLREIAQAAQAAIDQHLVPTAVEFTFSLMWLIVFAGVVITAIMAPLIRIFYSPGSQQKQ